MRKDTGIHFGWEKAHAGVTQEKVSHRQKEGLGERLELFAVWKKSFFHLQVFGLESQEISALCRLCRDCGLPAALQGVDTKRVQRQHAQGFQRG